MKYAGFKTAMAAVIGLILINFWSYGGPITASAATPSAPSSTAKPAACREATQSQLKGILRASNTDPKTAIEAIVTYLKDHSEWNGEQKYKMWEELVQRYNFRRENGFIIAPSLRTKKGDYVNWSGARGHLLIFRADGAIFKSFNPERPNPNSGSNYQIDWNDPTLRQLE
jgi:hypothetical protein